MKLSLPGFFIALALVLPELLTLAFPPKREKGEAGESAAYAQKPHILLSVCERLGLAGLLTWLVAGPNNLALLLLLRRFWFAAMCVCIALYWFAWYLWFSRGRAAAALYDPLWRIPFPMTVFSLLAYLCASFWTRSPFMFICWALYAVGSVDAARRGKRRVISARAEDPEGKREPEA